MNTRVYIEDLPRFLGQEVTLKGWLYNKRSSGKIRFVVMRDGTGFVQGVLVKGQVADEVIARFEELTQESSFAMTGTVREDKRSPGGVELDIRQIEILQRALDNFPFTQFMYVVNMEGRKITKNITHIVDRAKYETMGLDEDLSNRPWFIEPIKSGKVYVSDFYTSRFTGALCITVSLPIRDYNDETQGVLGMDIRFEDMVKMEQDGEI